MTKQEIILTILEHGAEITSKLLYQYGTISYRESVRRIGLLDHGEAHYERLDWVTPFKEAQIFYSTLSYLKAQGFIRKDTGKGFTSWQILKKGIQKLKKIKAKEGNSSKQLARHVDVQDDLLKVIIFDVPERNRKQRAWLRSALSSMGFSLLQKSVWIGKRKIPKEFFYELRRKKLFSCVHVFAVGKTGTFRNFAQKN